MCTCILVCVLFHFICCLLFCLPNVLFVDLQNVIHINPQGLLWNQPDCSDHSMSTTKRRIGAPNADHPLQPVKSDHPIATTTAQKRNPDHLNPWHSILATQIPKQRIPTWYCTCSEKLPNTQMYMLQYIHKSMYKSWAIYISIGCKMWLTRGCCQSLWCCWNCAVGGSCNSGIAICWKAFQFFFFSTTLGSEKIKSQIKIPRKQHFATLGFTTLVEFPTLCDQVNKTFAPNIGRFLWKFVGERQFFVRKQRRLWPLRDQVKTNVRTEYR